MTRERRASSSRSSTSRPPIVLEVEREVIDATVMSNLIPDPKWRYTDAQGHSHRFVSSGARHPQYTCPTLVEVVDCTYFCPDCHDEHTESHLACAQCGEAVEPKYIEGPTSFPLMGRTIYRINGQEVTKAEAEAQLGELLP